MALTEATEIDHRYGRIMNPNLQHYHVPVNADVLNVETMFVEEEIKSSILWASKAWASSEWLAFRRQSPTQYFMLLENVFAICR
jgi:hypothetical protein